MTIIDKQKERWCDGFLLTLIDAHSTQFWWTRANGLWQKNVFWVQGTMKRFNYLINRKKVSSNKKNICMMHVKQGFSFEQCNDKLLDNDATNCTDTLAITMLCIVVDGQWSDVSAVADQN